MPPDIIPSYTKDLAIELSGQRQHLETFHFFTREGGLFRAEEFLLAGGDYQYYLNVYSVGCSTQDFFIEHGSELMDQLVPQHDIVHTLLSLGMEDVALTRKIGRVAYKDMNLNDGSRGTITAKQIKSAVIDPDFRGAGLASNIYKMLVTKHDYLVCDNMQSISGGSLWASSILTLGEVRIYDIRANKFIDVLGKRGMGVGGCIPWSCQTLTVEQIEQWGRTYNPDACHHIVNVISRESLNEHYDDD